jgi:hypothetical protein
MASRGVRRATRPGHGVPYVRHLGHRLQLGRQFPGHPGAGRMELPPPLLRRRRGAGLYAVGLP